MKTFKNRGLEGSKIEENRRLEAFWKVLERLGASWGAMARFWVTFLEKLGEDGRNMSQVGSKLRPR